MGQAKRTNQPADPLAMYCLGCRYPLRGLTGDACPECGRRFDAQDPTTYSPTAKRWSWVVPVDGTGALLFALPLGYVFIDSVFIYGQRWWWRSNLLAIAFALFLIALITWIVLRLCWKEERSFSDAAMAGLAGGGLLLSGVIGGRGVLLYSISVSFAFCLVLSWRAWRKAAWKSQQLAAVAIMINGLGMLALLSQIPLHTTDIYDYWTYWFWTSQRY